MHKSDPMIGSGIINFRGTKTPGWFLVLILIFFLSSCTSTRTTTIQSKDQSSRRLILRDEGLSQLSLVDFADSTKNWHVPVPAGRDLQPVGRARILIGTGNGYEERHILTGNKVHEVSTFAGTIAARRLRNGNTLLVGLNWQGKEGIVLVELNRKDSIENLISFPGFTYVRLVRETRENTFLITADEVIFEGTRDGRITWKTNIIGREKPHVWQAVRLGNGNIIASTGFAANFQLFGKDGKLIDSIGGPANSRPHFFAGFQILANGNTVVTNWQGHGPTFGSSGIQLLEFTPQGSLAWSWKQDPAKFSSLQGVVVLDGLNTDKLHVENEKGVLAPVN